MVRLENSTCYGVTVTSFTVTIARTVGGGKGRTGGATSLFVTVASLRLRHPRLFPAYHKYYGARHRPVSVKDLHEVLEGGRLCPIGGLSGLQVEVEV